ncbi:MAG: Ig-like domain-containing protein [Thermoplasmata archaeon]|nr:MAG: Ig-like domain-containing protein [Thermoplasmata archaeon]
MCGRKVRRVFRVSLGILLILTAIQVMPFDGPFVDNASAGSSWVQTTEADFNTGILTNVTVTSEGNVTLKLMDKIIEDNFINESKISYINNIFVDNVSGDARLLKFNKTFDRLAGWDDHGYSVQETSDGGFIIAGSTYETGSAGWLIKTDSSGFEEWNNTFTGVVFAYGDSSVQEISTGGYIITGNMEAGDVQGILINADSSGVEKWKKRFGGINTDLGTSVQETSDGGFIIAGHTYSWGAGGTDAWLIKTDSSGSEEWNKTFGGSQGDYGISVQETSDSGFIIAGDTESFGAGNDDVWLIKTDSIGNEQWNRTFGGSNSDFGRSVQETSDGGFIITGYSWFTGHYDVRLIKTDSSGIEEWSKTFGGDRSDRGYSVRETPDGGFIIAGHTQSYGMGGDDVWLIKTDSSGNEKWNKTFGGGSTDTCYSIQVTSDKGFILTGSTYSFGDPDSDVWLIKTNETGCVPFFYGEITSVNLLSGQRAHSINNFTCTASVLPETEIKMQFSQDSINWYNSSGTLNGWDILSDGFNFIDLAYLAWQGGEFYYQMNFSSDNISSPVVQNIALSYSQYLYSGSLESQQLNLASDVKWKTITWTAFEPLNTNIKFQLNSDSTIDFVGPGGSASTYYEFSGTDIWSGHDFDSWIQYKVYLDTIDASVSPILEDVTIFYNFIPDAPNLNTPPADLITNDSTPMFRWQFSDSDGFQDGFQVLIDDDYNFGSVDYDSGQQSSTDEFWQFPINTGYTEITDGIWFWKVRTRDDDGDWSPYSLNWSFTIDTTVLSPDEIRADPLTWTSTNFFEVTWADPTDLSGIAGAYYKLDSPPTSNTDGTYVPGAVNSISSITVSGDGEHTIYIWLKDVVNNVDYTNYNTTILYYDSIPPSSPIDITAVPSSWTNDDNFDIYWTNPFDTSGIAGAYMKLDSPPTSNTDFDLSHSDPGINSIGAISVNTEGAHQIYIWLEDNASNTDYSTYNETTLYYDATAPSSPLDVTANPSSWTSTNLFDVLWTNPADLSGIAGAFYKLDNPPTSDTDGTYVAGGGITSLNDITVSGDGAHTIYIWLKDNASNTDYTTYSTTVLYYDSTAPSTPTDVMGAPDTWAPTNSFDVTWTDPSELSGIAGTYYKLDSPPTSDTDGTYVPGSGVSSIEDITVTGEGQHTIYIWLVDLAGNTNHTTYNSTFLYYDSTAPSLPIGIAADPSTWTPTNSFTVTWTNPVDDSGIMGAYYKLDSPPTSNTDGTYVLNPGISSISDITVSGDGQHTIYVWLKDDGGNVDYNNHNSVIVYYDGSAPTEPTGMTINPSTWTYTNSFTIDWTEPFDDSGIKTGVYYYIGNSPPSSQSDGTWTSEKPFTITNAPEGATNIYLWLEDNVGNKNYLNYGIGIMQLDTNSPSSFTPVADYASWTSNSNFNITFSTTDATSGIDHYEVKIGTGGFSTQSSPYLFPPQIDGIHNITVRAFDEAGNYIDGYVDIYIDTDPPTITHTPVTSGTIGDPINITATVTDDGSGVENVILYYKKPTETSYAQIHMTANGNVYSADIPGTVVTSEGIEYYIEVKDKANPPNILYFSTPGSTNTEPDSSNDIDITITGADSIYPSVVDYSPEGSNVPLDTTISVAFSKPMDQDSVESAFTISPTVGGVYEWIGATLTFTPSSPLKAVTQYNVTISIQAKDLEGRALQKYHNWSFITGGEAEKETSFWETWEPIITGVTILFSLLLFLVGFLSLRKKRSKLRQYLERVDDTYNKYKENYQECEQELIALREDIKAEVKEGKLEENHFLILDKKIDDYIMEMKSLEKEEAGIGLEEDITEPVSESVSEEEDIGGGFE